MDIENWLEEIPTAPSWPNCKLYQLPHLDVDRYITESWQFNEGSENEWVPDVWMMSFFLCVSEKAKKIIERVDNFQHQFTPMQYLDHRGNPVNKGPYYWLNVRRILKIEPSELPMDDVDFASNLEERKFLPTVQHNKELRERIETLPVWRHHRAYGKIYINEKLLMEFKKENTTGLEEYTEPLGSEEESIGHV